MRSFWARMALAFWLTVTTFSVGAAIEADVAPSVAMAQSPTSIGKIESKLEGIRQLLLRLGYIGVGIAVLVVGSKFLQGDPHAWRYTMFTVLGAAIIFGSAEVVTWLQN